MRCQEEAKFKHQKNKQSFIKYLIATIIAGAFLFIHIGWCVFLTEGKDLTDFSKLDDVVFLAFAFSEIFTIIIAFLLASKCGKKLAALNITKFQILSANAVEHKNDALDKYPNVITKKYFDHYTYRIVVFSPKENIFAYMLERFDIKTLSWDEKLLKYFGIPKEILPQVVSNGKQLGIAHTKYGKIKIGAIFLSGIVICFFVTGPIYNMCNIGKGSSKEAFSIILQQFARITKYKENGLTDEEKQNFYLK